MIRGASCERSLAGSADPCRAHACVLRKSSSVRGQDTSDELELGKTALEMGRVDEALAIFSKLASAEPQAQVHFYRGLAFRVKGKFPQALEDFNKAIALDPKQPLYYLRRGILLLRSAKYQEALSDFAGVTELDPEQDQAFGYPRRALFFLGRQDEALRDLNRALQQNPPRALFTLYAVIYCLPQEIMEMPSETMTAGDSIEAE